MVKTDKAVKPMTPEYITKLFKPTAKKQTGRKVWNVDLETVWIPFFIASNTSGVSDIPKDAIGCPLRVSYDKDGAVRFSKQGRLMTSVAKPLTEAITMIRENFVAGLENYTHTVATENEQAYNDMVKACVKAGKPIISADRANVDTALKRIADEAVAHAEAEAEVRKQAEAGTEAEAGSDGTHTEAEAGKELVAS